MDEHCIKPSKLIILPVSYANLLQWSYDPSKADEHTIEIPWNRFRLICTQKFCVRANRFIICLVDWYQIISQMISQIKWPNVVVLRWLYVVTVVRPVGYIFKFSEKTLYMVSGGEMHTQCRGNSSGGHYCTYCSTSIARSPLTCCICGIVLYWRTVHLKWPLIVTSPWYTVQVHSFSLHPNISELPGWWII